jgi:hypothetical protein
MNTVLIAALIERQDAMARRAARKINALLDTHLNALAVDILTLHLAAQAHRALLTIPAKMAARLAPETDPAAVHRVLTEEITDVLHELADAASSDPATLPPLPPEEPRAVARRSRTLAEARAQNARLGARLIDLKGRIVPYRGPGGAA